MSSKTARGSHEEALSLVKRLQASRSAWVYARHSGRLNLRWRAYKRCWAELRGNTLLLHVVGEEGARQPPRPDIHRKGAADNILLISLKDTRMRSEPKKNKLKIKRNSEPDMEVKLKDSVETKKWHTDLTRAATQRTVGLSDFQIIAQVGKGASGRVFLVRDKVTGEHLALKVIEKSAVYENNDAYRHALDERLVLEMACEHPFILDLRYAFQTARRLYLVTEYCEGGDLFEFLKKRGRPFREPKAKLIAAEILLALEHIHGLEVVYRDLKLENVLLDVNGHVRIADFGLSKMLGKPQQRKPNRPGMRHSASMQQAGAAITTAMTKTFCGTREYVAPEMLNGSEYGQSVDLWAFGILLYEILCGRTPFYSKHRDEVYDRIENAQLKFPRHLSADVVSLIRGLLDRNPQTRLGLGVDGISAIKRHPFFADVNWEAVYQCRPNPDRIEVEKNTLIEAQKRAMSQKVMGSSNMASSKNTAKSERTLRSAKSSRNQSDFEAGGLTGQDADALLGEDAGKERGSRKPDILSIFVSTKKKTNTIAGYSFITPAKKPPGAPPGI